MEKLRKYHKLEQFHYVKNYSNHTKISRQPLIIESGSQSIILLTKLGWYAKPNHPNLESNE